MRKMREHCIEEFWLFRDTHEVLGGTNDYRHLGPTGSGRQSLEMQSLSQPLPPPYNTEGVAGGRRGAPGTQIDIWGLHRLLISIIIKDGVEGHSGGFV